MKPAFSAPAAAKRLVAAISLMMCASLPALAQESFADEHIAAAKSALTAAGSTKRLDSILPRIAQQHKGELILSRPDMEGTISDIVDDAAIALAPRRGDLENEIARIYARVFSKDDLKIIAEFYGSETGQKLLKETPIILRQIEQAAKTWSAGIGRDLRVDVGKKVIAAENKTE